MDVFDTDKHKNMYLTDLAEKYFLCRCLNYVKIFLNNIFYPKYQIYVYDLYKISQEA